jgi:hypothetical protein
MHVLAYCMTLVVTIINADEELYFKIALTLIFYSGLGTHCFVMEGKDPLSIQKVFAFEKIITSSYAKDPLSTNEQYSLYNSVNPVKNYSAKLLLKQANICSYFKHNIKQPGLSSWFQ